MYIYCILLSTIFSIQGWFVLCNLYEQIRVYNILRSFEKIELRLLIYNLFIFFILGY